MFIFDFIKKRKKINENNKKIKLVKTNLDRLSKFFLDIEKEISFMDTRINHVEDKIYDMREEIKKLKAKK